MAQRKIRADKTQLKVKAGKIHTAKGKRKFSRKKG
jgi:hypothetical protein